jgi:hypothetical protein
MKTMTASTTRYNLLSKEDEQAIVSEITVLIDDMRKGMSQLDTEATFKNFINTPEFNYISQHGTITDYAGLLKEANEVFIPARKVQSNYRVDNIKVLSRESAVATYISSGTFYFDDYKLYYPDCATSLVCVKRPDGWKVIQMQECVQESEFVQTML